MSYTLIITEKPSVAAEIAAALGKFQVVKKTDTSGQERKVYYTNNKDVYISWAFGHLVQYDAKRPSDMSQLPAIPKKEDWVIKALSPSHEFQLNIIKDLMTDDKVTHITNACDAEREGELIFNLIVDACGVKRSSKSIERMWIQSMNKPALIKAYNTRKPASEYEGLNQASRSRAKADWLVGINASSAFSAIGERIWATSQPASIGRVKTAALAIIYFRNEKIKNFVPVTYWDILAKFGSPNGEFEGRWIDMSRYKIPDADKSEMEEKGSVEGKPTEKNGVEDCSRITTKEHLDEIVARITENNVLKKPISYKDVVTRKETNSRPLFNLLQAQVQAGVLFKFTSKKTLEVIQRLYEKKAVTYPRTDSAHLPEDYPNEVKEILKALKTSPTENWGKFTQEALDGVDGVKKRVFNNANVSDHFAIIPTTDVPSRSSLDADELKLYEMIVNRFKAVFLPPLITDVTTRFTFVGEKDAFRSNGTVIIQKGWTEIEAREDKDNTLPKIEDVSSISSKSYETQSKKTQPPKPFKETDLLIAMKNAGKDLDDHELVEAMDGKGIGTPATRAQIIEELLAAQTSSGAPKQPMLVREKNGVFLITEYGTKIIQTLLANDIFELTSPKFTGQWEYDLEKVRQDATLADSFMSATEKTVIDIVGKLKNLYSKYPAPKFNENCRKCGSSMEIERYKVSCSSPSCEFKIPRTLAGHTFTIPELEVLIKFGKTTEFYEFTRKDKKKFEAGVQFDAENNLAFFFRPDVIREEPCPLCKGVLSDRKQLIKCQSETCGLVIFKEVSGKKLSEKHLKQLLTDKKTETITGFYSKKKQTKFDSALIIDEKEKKMIFAPYTNDGTETDYACLKKECDGKYIEKSKLFVCSKDCGSQIWRSSYNTDIPASKLTKLLKGNVVSITGKRKQFEDGKESLISQAMNLHVSKEDGKVKSEFVNPAKK